MPPIMALLPALIGLAGTGITTGLELSGAGQPSAPSTLPLTSGVKPLPTTATPAQQTQASTADANYVSQVGNSLSPGAWAQLQESLGIPGGLQNPYGTPG
jgi:hypothetical protein